MDCCNGSSHNTRSSLSRATVWKTPDGQCAVGYAAWCGQCGQWQTPEDGVPSPVFQPLLADILAGEGHYDVESPGGEGCVLSPEDRIVSLLLTILEQPGTQPLPPRWNGDADYEDYESD